MNKFKHIDSVCASEPKLQVFTQSHKSPLYLSSTFQFESVEQGIDIFQHQPGHHVYTRYGNPGLEAVAQKIADLETFPYPGTASGILTSSGMAAIHVAIQSLLDPGDVLITQGNLYGGTTELFEKVVKKSGIQLEIIDLRNVERVEKVLQEYHGRKKCLFLETPSNPTLSCLDLKSLVGLSKNYHAFTIVDNTFATPILQKPILMGADMVIHSTTKYLHGHGLSTGGVVVIKNPSLHHQKVWEVMKLTGCNSNPFDAWLINLGLKTLALRIRQQSHTAQCLAEALNGEAAFNMVNYPGLPNSPNHAIASTQMELFGAMISFEVGRNQEDAIAFCNKLKLCSIAPSLGETDTMVLHPASMSHVKVPKDVRLYYGITDNLVRLSVGLENPEDILDDILQAAR